MEPSEEQVDAWVTTFEYRNDHTGQLYPELLTARDQLIGQLGLRGQTDAESLANLRELCRGVLIQIAQFLRQPTGKTVPGYNLPLVPERKGLLVTSDENATRLISRFIAPNDLAIAAAGTGRVTPYRIKARLVQSVAEILRAGYFLIDALTRARGGAGVKPTVTQLVDAIHNFREAVSRAHDAGVTARYSPTPEEKLEVAFFATDLLNAPSPKGISTDARLRLQELFVTQERAYTAARGERPSVRAPVVERRAATNRPEPVVSLPDRDETPMVVKAAAAVEPPVETATAAETVQEIAAQYYGGIVTGRFGTTLEGTPPPLLYVDGRPYRGSDAARYWERAVRFYTNPRFGQGELTEIWWRIEMADDSGSPIPLPDELLAHYKPKR